MWHSTLYEPSRGWYTVTAIYVGLVWSGYPEYQTELADSNNQWCILNIWCNRRGKRVNAEHKRATLMNVDSQTWSKTRIRKLTTKAWHWRTMWGQSSRSVDAANSTRTRICAQNGAHACSWHDSERRLGIYTNFARSPDRTDETPKNFEPRPPTWIKIGHMVGRVMAELRFLLKMETVFFFWSRHYGRIKKVNSTTWFESVL